MSMLAPVGGSVGACDTGWLGTAGAGRCCGEPCSPLDKPLESPLVSLGTPDAVRLDDPVLDGVALLVEPVPDDAAPPLEDPSPVAPLLEPVVAPLGLAV